jgi:CRISPR-associated protein Csb3
MAVAHIPVDLLNPGQVFACYGFLETADLLLGGAKAHFDWSHAADVRFVMDARTKRNPFGTVLEFLSNATVYSVASAGSKHTTEKWGVPTLFMQEDAPLPSPDPRSPATLPALLKDDSGRQIMIGHWGDMTVRDNVKFWAGAGGYPGAALTRDVLNLVRQLPPSACADPFSFSAPQSSSFRFDWRRDYIPMNIGFSPNEHAAMTMLGYPLVELLAAIGLENARPYRLRGKLDYRYGVVGSPSNTGPLSPVFLRAALGCASLPFPRRTFRMRLDWPGQENQARCITEVFEETLS